MTQANRRRQCRRRAPPALFMAVERGAIVDVAEAAETVLRDREHDDRES
jgi:hypothetical protein